MRGTKTMDRVEERRVLSRRGFVAGAAALCVVGSYGAWGFEPEDEVVVRMPLGALRGRASQGVRRFLGVPFAKPPNGPRRFQPPIPVAPWKGTRDALQYAAAASQAQSFEVGTSEDCLYLNVWSPATPGPHPVLVWIHGGGFFEGRSSDDGAVFAREGIVCVSIAYRLGVFGFLDLSPLLGASFDGCGNNAVRDVICALQWVRANIAAFGGDPGRVTIGGQSAGGKMTGILMGVPSAQPLFQQMICEAGGAERVWLRQDAVKAGEAFGQTWSRMGKGKDDLKTASQGDLIHAQQAFMREWSGHYPLRPEIDGRLLTDWPVAKIRRGLTRGKRLLIGSNHDESAAFVGPAMNREITAHDLGNMPLAEFQKKYEQYDRLYPHLDSNRRKILALTAEEYWMPSIRLADAHLAGGGKAWMYRLDFQERAGRLAGLSYHSLDNVLVWNHPRAESGNVEQEAALGQKMHDAWTSFIMRGAPAAEGLPAWPPYTEPERRTMILNVDSVVESKPQQADVDLWNAPLS